MNSYVKLIIFFVIFITVVAGAIYVYRDLKTEYYAVKKEYIRGEKAKAVGGVFKGILPFGNQ